jgi:hypothetical protein
MTMTRPDEDLGPGEIEDLEAPPEDAVEQSKSVKPAEEPVEVNRGLEVGEWDAVEQSIVIDMDDDYDH